MEKMRINKNNCIAKAFLICLLIVSLVVCMAGCNRNNGSGASAAVTEGTAEKEFRNQMSDASVTDIVVSGDLVLTSPVEVAGNKVISGDGSITAAVQNTEGDYLIVVPSDAALTLKGEVTVDAAGVMGGVHVQEGASWTLEENATVKNASAKAANALVEGKLLISGGILEDANGHNIYNKNETVIAGGVVAGSGEACAAVYNAGKLTLDDGSVCDAYHNIVSLSGSGFTFNKGTISGSEDDSVVIEEGATLNVTSSEAVITASSHIGIVLSGEAVIDDINLNDSFDTLLKVTATGKLTLNGGKITDAGLHGVDNAGTMLMTGGMIYSNYNCGIVNTGSLEVTGGDLMNNANKGILNKLEGVAKVVSEDVTISGNKFNVGNEDNAYFEIANATVMRSTNANVYAYGGKMYIHDIALGASASNNIRVVAAELTMENVEVQGNTASGSTSTHGILLEGGTVKATDVTINGTTGNGIRNKGGNFVGTNITISNSGNHGIGNTNQDVTGRAGYVTIDGLVIENTKYNNILSDGGVTTLTNATLNKSGTNNIKVNDGKVVLNNVKVLGNADSAASNVHGFYVAGGTVEAKDLYIANTKGAALRVDGETAVASMTNVTAENLGTHGINSSVGAITVTNATFTKTSSNVIRIDAGTMNLNNVTVQGHKEGSASNVHGVYATGGKLTAKNLTVSGTTGAGIRNDGGNVQITDLNVSNVGTHNLYHSNKKSSTTIVNATLEPCASNNIVVSNGTVDLTDVKVLGQVESGAQDMHGIYATGGTLKAKNLTITGTSGSAIRNKGCKITAENLDISSFRGYNAVSNAANDSGKYGDVTIDGLTITNALTPTKDLIVISNECKGSIAISNATINVNTETVNPKSNIEVDSGLVTLTNVDLGKSSSNNIRVNGGTLDINGVTVAGHIKGAASNVHGLYTPGGKTTGKNLTVSGTTGSAIRNAGGTIDLDSVTISNVGVNALNITGGTTTLNNATINKNSTHTVYVTGGKVYLNDSQLLGHVDGTADNIHSFYVIGGTVTLDNVYITNSAGDGIRVDDNVNDAGKVLSYGTVNGTNVTIKNTGRHGIWLSDGKMSMNGLTVENVTKNNILIDDGKTSLTNVILGKANTNSIKITGGDVTMKNVEILGQVATAASDVHGICMEGDGTLDAYNIFISDTTGQAIRNKGSVTNVEKLVLSNIGSTTLISNVSYKKNPGELTVSSLSVNGGCDHADYVIWNQDETSTVEVNDSTLFLGSNTTGIYAQKGTVTTNNVSVVGAYYAVLAEDGAAFTMDGGAMLNNVWAVRLEEGSSATLKDAYFYGNAEGVLPSDIYNAGKLTIDNITVGYNSLGEGKSGLIYQAATAEPITMIGKAMGLHNASMPLQLATEEWVKAWGTDRTIVICESDDYATAAKAYFVPGKNDPVLYISRRANTLELTTMEGGNFIVKIDDTYFESFADAFAYMDQNDITKATLQVVDSFGLFENVVIPEGYNITLVDDGTALHTITNNTSGNMFTVGEGESLTIQSTNSTGTGLAFNGANVADAAVVCVNGGNVTVEGEISIANAVNGVNVKSGSFTVADNGALKVSGCTYGILAEGGTTVIAELNGSGCYNNIMATGNGTEVTVNGGTFSKSTSNNVVSEADALVTLNQVTISGTTNESTHGVLAQGGDVVLNNVAITEANTAGIRVNTATSKVTVTGSLTIENATYAISISAGEVEVTGSKIDGKNSVVFSAISRNIVMDGGSVTVSNATFNATSSHNVHPRKAGAVVTLTDCEINGGGQYGVLAEHGKAILENVTINGCNHAIRANQDTSVVEAKNITIQNANAYGISISNKAQITIDGATITNSGSYDVYVASSSCTLNVSGKLDLEKDIYFNAANCLNVTGALTEGSNVTVDWANGKQPADYVAIKFASEADMNASENYIKLGDIQGASYRLRYLNDETNGAYAELALPDSTSDVITSEAELTQALNEAIRLGKTELELKIGASFTVSNQVTIPEGMAVTIKDDGDTETGNTITYNGTETGAFFTQGANSTLSLDGITIDGGGKSNVQVPANATLKVSDVTIMKTSGNALEANGAIIAEGNLTVKDAGSWGIVTWESSSFTANDDVVVTISGGTYGLVARKGSTVTLDTLNVSGGSESAIYCQETNTKVIIKTAVVNGAKMGLNVKSGTVEITDLAISNTTGNGMDISGGTVTLTDATVDKSNWAVRANSANLTVTGTLTLKNSSYGMVSESNSVVEINELITSGITNSSIYVNAGKVTIDAAEVPENSGDHNVYVANGGTLNLSNATIGANSNSNKHTFYQKNGTVNIDDVALKTGADGHAIYHERGTLNIQGKIESDIYFTDSNTLHVTEKLTGDVEVQWATGSEPADTAITFASADVMNASKACICLGANQNTQYVLSYDDSDNTASLLAIAGTISNDTELQAVLAELAENPKTAAYRLTGDIELTTARIDIVAGVNLTLIADAAEGEQITISRGAYTGVMLTVRDGASLTILTADGTVDSRELVFKGTSGNAKMVTVEGSGELIMGEGIELSGNTHGSNGQAVYCAGTSSYIANGVYIANNTGNAGGAIRFDSTGKLILTNSKFINNTSNTGFGGAISLNGKNAIVNIVGCEFKGNVAKSATDAQGGGALILQNGPIVTISNSVFDDNSTALSGGAIRFNSGTMTIIDTVFKNNKTTGSGNTSRGGAIYSVSTLTIDGTEFTGNENNGDHGGAIYSGNTLTVTNSSFAENSTKTNGGAIEMNAAKDLKVTGCTFTKNSAAEGGAMMFQTSPSVTIKDCIFEENSAKTNGGAVKNNSSTTALQIIGSTFKKNTAITNGGALANQDGKGVAVSDSAFSGNTATNGNAVYSTGGTVTLTNCSIIETDCAGKFSIKE